MKENKNKFNIAENMQFMLLNRGFELGYFDELVKITADKAIEGFMKGIKSKDEEVKLKTGKEIPSSFAGLMDELTELRQYKAEIKERQDRMPDRMVDGGK